jgi:hypothetical protein
MKPVESREIYLRILQMLAPLRHVYVMGGFAEDALLRHAITRDRVDIDLLTDADAWDELRSELADVGVSAFGPQVAGPCGEPIAFRSSGQGLPVEVWLASRDHEGHAIVLPGDGSTWFRLRLPADTFDFPGDSLEDVAVQTVSPLALCLFRAASAQTRGDARKRAEDSEMLRRLAHTLLPGVKEEALVPQIETILSSEG